MKVFIVYDKYGEERGYVYAKNHNDAEKKEHYIYCPQVFVVYTEI